MQSNVYLDFVAAFVVPFLLAFFLSLFMLDAPLLLAYFYTFILNKLPYENAKRSEEQIRANKPTRCLGKNNMDIFPSNEVVLQQYNSMLSLLRMKKICFPLFLSFCSEIFSFALAVFSAHKIELAPI